MAFRETAVSPACQDGAMNDAIRTAATEALDKQLRTMKSELERISRNFKSELTDLHNELPKIEERGRAAAMTVQAYRSTMLSVLDN